MKSLFIIIVALVFSAYNIFAQILNGSFETGTGNPSLGQWVYLCAFGNSSSDVPSGGGNWSLEKEAGNTQGCWPGDAYQTLPSVQSGTVLLLKAWVKSDPGVGQTIGIYIGKKGSSNFPDKIAGDTTSSKSWTMLSVQDTFAFGAGEQAAVILDPGMVSGPAAAKAYFDLVSLESPVTTGIGLNQSHAADALRIYSAPSKEITQIEWQPSTTGENIISVFSADGRLMQRHIVSVSQQNIFTFRINTSQFPASIYFIHVSMPGKTLKRGFLIR
jgi:hypothetical protein